MPRYRRGVEYEGTPELTAPGMSIPKRAPKGIAAGGTGSNQNVSYVTGYTKMSFYLTTDGQTRNDSGTAVTPVELSSHNSDLAQWGFSFPGESGDLNQWARTIQMPSNYDSSRPIVVTLHIIQE